MKKMVSILLLIGVMFISNISTVAAQNITQGSESPITASTREYYSNIDITDQNTSVTEPIIMRGPQVPTDVWNDWARSDFEFSGSTSNTNSQVYTNKCFTALISGTIVVNSNATSDTLVRFFEKNTTGGYDSVVYEFTVPAGGTKTVYISGFNGNKNYYISFMGNFLSFNGYMYRSN